MGVILDEGLAGHLPYAVNRFDDLY